MTLQNEGRPLSEDTIRVLEFRKSMAQYRDERSFGGRKQASFLKEAARQSTPKACQGKACSLDPKQCAHGETLFAQQKKMCIEKMNAICNVLKFEAASAARNFQHELALAKRREAVRIHSAIVEASPQFDPGKHRARLANQRYLEYWWLVTEGSCALLGGDFNASREYFTRALKAAQLLPMSDCFPNYFYDLREAQAHQLFIDAVENVKRARFAEARDLFQSWLNLKPAPRHYLRYDNIWIFRMICNILALLIEGAEEVDWDDLDRAVDEAYVARGTWALLSTLEWLREVSFKSKTSNEIASRFNLKDEVNKIAERWQLFLSDGVLLGEDRTAGLRRDVSLLSFTDMFDEIDHRDPDWQQLLYQNQKNLLLIMADYERLRWLDRREDEADLPGESLLPAPSEQMTMAELTEIIASHLNRRSPQKAAAFQKALKHLEATDLAMRNGSFTETMRMQRALFEHIRFWPHVIRVESQKQLPAPMFCDERNPNVASNEAVCSRLWNRQPAELTLRGPQKLKEGSYYYLRPIWNIRVYDEYSPRWIRHERFLETDVPRLVNVFHDGIFGRGTKADPRRFREWILGFDSRERLLACKLFDMVRYYSEDAIREMWLRLYEKQLPPEAKVRRVAYAGLGHTAKSGPYHCQYHFRQAISKLENNQRSFDISEAFRELSEIHLRAEKPETVIFIDDFIGEGTQALKWFVNDEDAYFKKYPWLEDCTVYYCVLVGFRSGIDAIRQELCPRLIKEVLAAQELDEKDRVFSYANPLWKSAQELLMARTLAEDVGFQVLTGMKRYDPEKDKLGWRDSQALVVFHYNVPNNTLPVFWGEGERNGKKWKPLWDRHD